MRDPLEGVDDDGCIRTGADRTRVPATYEPVVEALVAAFEGVRPPTAPASLLLYGSVATGQARPPGSDVDVLVVGVPRAAAASVGEDLSGRFRGLAREVAVGAGQPADHQGDDDEAHGNRAFLRHYCVLLAGDDVTAGWPPFPADVRAARGFNGDLATCLARWRREGGAASRLDRPQAAALGRRVARKTLLAAAGLVSVHDATWTTDRTTGAHRWAEVDPAVGDDLRELLAWAEGFSAATGAEVRRVLGPHGAVQRVADAFRDRIGLWDLR